MTAAEKIKHLVALECACTKGRQTIGVERGSLIRCPKCNKVFGAITITTGVVLWLAYSSFT